MRRPQIYFQGWLKTALETYRVAPGPGHSGRSFHKHSTRAILPSFQSGFKLLILFGDPPWNRTMNLEIKSLSGNWKLAAISNQGIHYMGNTWHINAV
jgi:hypothetical protein